MKKKILVVDDELSVCEGVKLVLESSGYDVKAAPSGEDAVRMVGLEDFDIVLMDLIMPGMDGADACEKIKSMKPHVHVLAISGSPSLERLEKFLHAGGIEIYLYKPFGKEELIDAIEKVFRGEYMKFHENA